MNKHLRILIVMGLAFGLLLIAPLALANTASAWAPNVAYKVGDQVTYSGTTYQNLQAHTSQLGWEPPAVPALWQVVAGATSAATATRTNTPAGPTPTKTKTPVPNATATPSGANCWSAWNATIAYVGGAQASRNGQNYQAAFWTQNQDPAIYNGPAGSGQPWLPMGGCGGGSGTVTPGATATPTRTSPPAANTATPTSAPANGLPSHLSALYADISFTSIKSAYQATGQKYYALAFVLGKDGACTPAWDGQRLMSENYYANEISTLRSGGGDIGAVFGGANGSDLASVCPTVGSLQAAIQAVINQYQLKWIDLNVEGGMLSDPVSVDRRNKALAALQAANPNLRVSYTLPVAQAGLLQTALDLLSNAKANGVRVDYVNIMTMNYGPAGIDMGQAAIDAATNTRQQLLSLGLSAKIGITPMIGQNDSYGEIFTLSDAEQLITFAKANSYIGWLSFWSLGRDNGNCPGQTTASAICSGISQSTYDFTLKFKAFP